jgi:hypothetical protein
VGHSPGREYIDLKKKKRSAWTCQIVFWPLASTALRSRSVQGDVSMSVEDWGRAVLGSGVQECIAMA